MKLIVALSLLAAASLSACSAPPRYAYVKEGASTHTTRSDMSKCEYNIKLQKTPIGERDALQKLCMEGEGYRLKRIN